jgi:hypothetical protein
MLEYVFFDRRPYRKFIDYLRAKGVEPESEAKDEAFAMASLEVRIPQGLGDELEEEIEAFYDRMMEWGQELAEEVEEGDCHSAGVVLNLKDGRTVYAQVDPGLLGRVMEVLTPEELGEMVNAIVDAVEQPDERSFCQRMRDGE